MSDTVDIDTLRNRVAVLSGDLRQATEAYHQALIAAAPFKVGDIVEVQPNYSGPWTQAIIRWAKVRYGSVVFGFAVATKSGWHKTVRDYCGDRMRPLSEATP